MFTRKRRGTSNHDHGGIHGERRQLVDASTVTTSNHCDTNQPPNPIMTDDDRVELAKLLKNEDDVEDSHQNGSLPGKETVATELTTVNASTNEEEDSEELMKDVHLLFETSVLSQVSLPLFVAGMGMVCAGLLLDHTQDTIVFRNVREIYILVPALLGLKGNLEMTMASRLSSMGNLRLLVTSQQRYSVFVANVALTQCQSIVVGLLAALFASLMSWINLGTSSLSTVMLLAATSIVTACLASFILSSIMMAIIIWSLDHEVDPDNIATPIAAALGDLITLYILYITSWLYYSSSTLVCSLSIGFSLCLVLLWWHLAGRHPLTKIALHQGWIPVLSAMIISSFGGCILNHGIAKYGNIAVFQPVINGVGGNLVAIQASRMSTFLHRTKSVAISTLSPMTFLSRFDTHCATARLLLALVVPIHALLYLILHAFHSESPSNPVFIVLYLSAACIQVLILLFLAELIINWLWAREIDPDNSAIPYLTAFGDLFGTLFLFIAFALYHQMFGYI